MGESRPRNESGQYVATRSPKDVFDAMEPLDTAGCKSIKNFAVPGRRISSRSYSRQYEPYATGELADRLGWPRRTVYELLSTLEERGDVRKKKPEPRRAIWIRPEDTV